MSLLPEPGSVTLRVSGIFTRGKRLSGVRALATCPPCSCLREAACACVCVCACVCARVWVCACVCVCARVCVLSCVRLLAHQAPLSMGFPRQEYWSRLPCPPPQGDFLDPRIKPASPALQADSLPLRHWGSPRWKPHLAHLCFSFCLLSSYSSLPRHHPHHSLLLLQM